LLSSSYRHTIVRLGDDELERRIGAGGARAVVVRRSVELADAAARVGLTRRPLAVVLVGGAAGMSEGETETLQRLFVEGLAPLVEEADGLVVDGGTDAGVMRASGRARAQVGGRFPLVGVLPVELAASAQLEPNHSHFVLVPGSRWGDESQWLPRLASVLGERSVCVLAGGGAVARRDLERNRAAGLSVLVLAGSGGLADEVAAEAVETAPVGEPAAVADALRRLAR
jgi:hypothetical protein